MRLNLPSLYAAGVRRSVLGLLAFSFTLSFASVPLVGQTLIEPLERGWYNEFGFHDPANPNFFVGDGRGSLGGVPTPYSETRNFFVFDLSTLSSPVATATLSLTIFENLGFSTGFVSNNGDPVEDYQLVDVTSDPFDLVTGCVGDPSFFHLPDTSCQALGQSIFTDLGSGSSYGGVTITTDDIGTQLHVPLNGAAVAELEAARTSTLIFSVGGHLTTLDRLANDEFAFAGTAELGTVAELILNTTVDGDFNDDGTYDCRDIDALVGSIAGGANDATFDLNGDGQVDAADIDGWLTEAGAANLSSGSAFDPGDANLDGLVDVSDFNLWNANRGNSLAAWCSGDFNADGAVDEVDFTVWNANRFSNTPEAAAVPEPASVFALFVGWLSVLVLRRRMV